MASLEYNTKEAINHSLDIREQRAVHKIKSKHFKAMPNLSQQ